MQEEASPIAGPEGSLSPEASGLPTQEFDQAQLQEAWDQFVHELKEAGRKRLHGSLSHKEIQKGDKHKVIITLINQVQQKALQEVMPELLPRLREKLQNHRLQLEVKMAPMEKARLEPYSQEEKWRYLLDKNPALQELRNKLNLDFE